MKMNEKINKNLNGSSCAQSSNFSNFPDSIPAYLKLTISPSLTSKSNAYTYSAAVVTNGFETKLNLGSTRLAISSKQLTLIPQGSKALLSKFKKQISGSTTEFSNISDTAFVALSKIQTSKIAKGICNYWKNSSIDTFLALPAIGLGKLADGSIILFVKNIEKYTTKNLTTIATHLMGCIPALINIQSSALPAQQVALPERKVKARSVTTSRTPIPQPLAISKIGFPYCRHLAILIRPSINSPLIHPSNLYPSEQRLYKI